MFTLTLIIAKLDLENLNGEKSYSAMTNYGNSKLLQLLGAFEMQRRFNKDGVSTTVNTVHPGFVRTDIGRTESRLLDLLRKFVMQFAKSPEDGALTAVYCAISSEVVGYGGRYYKNSREATPSRQARDAELARAVYDIAEDILAKAMPRDKTRTHASLEKSTQSIGSASTTSKGSSRELQKSGSIPRLQQHSETALQVLLEETHSDAASRETRSSNGTLGANVGRSGALITRSTERSSEDGVAKGDNAGEDTENTGEKTEDAKEKTENAGGKTENSGEKTQNTNQKAKVAESGAVAPPPQFQIPDTPSTSAEVSTELLATRASAGGLMKASGVSQVSVSPSSVGGSTYSLDAREIVKEQIAARSSGQLSRADEAAAAIETLLEAASETVGPLSVDATMDHKLGKDESLSSQLQLVRESIGSLGMTMEDDESRVQSLASLSKQSSTTNNVPAEESSDEQLHELDAEADSSSDEQVGRAPIDISLPEVISVGSLFPDLEFANVQRESSVTTLPFSRDAKHYPSTAATVDSAKTDSTKMDNSREASVLDFEKVT